MIMFHDRYWRYMLQFESVELVKRIFKKIHNRNLNTTRAKQIVAAYSQGKEYYLNAAKADISVKPLLLFYGISSLSRCLILLLKINGGEETLIGSHGLSCKNWNSTLSPELETSLKNIGDLHVESCNGLFQNLLKATNNMSCLHERTSGVDWTASFPIPQFPISITFSEITKRIPDVEKEYTLWTNELSLVTSVNEFSYLGQEYALEVKKRANIKEIVDYAEGRITLSDSETNLSRLKIGKEDLPLFINSFVEKQFDKIPILYITKPLPKNVYVSQIPLTFILSYFLGMLCRYFPSHWMALSRGNIGDEAWPLMQSCITYIDKSFPQLLAEFIQEKSKK